MEQTVLALVSTLGGNVYAAIFAAMLLTGIGFPLPGELTLGFTGYLLFSAQVKWLPAVVAAAAGDFLGAFFSYSIGFFCRTQRLTGHLRFLTPSPSKLEAITVWLEQYGIMAVIGGRLIPVVRGAIPIPAGFAAMNVKKYIAGIIVSSVIWCSALIYMGFWLGHGWRQIAGFGSQFVLAAAGVLGVVLMLWCARRYLEK